MSVFPTQQEIIDGLTHEVERLKKENQKLKSLISSKNNDLLGIGDVINRRELLVVFILWYWFKCENKETREAGDLIDEFLATNSL